MRILIQRVKRASVEVDGKEIGAIKSGLLAFVGFCADDDISYIRPMAEKMAGLRIFEDKDEKMNYSVLDVGGDVLAISQFTLYADCKKGRRPSFSDAMSPSVAKDFYDEFVDAVGDILGKSPQTGEFGADMKVSLLNDGPVTIMLDSEQIIKK